MKMTMLWVGALIILLLDGCAVMPRQIMDDALPSMAFSQLVRDTDKYIGETVVLGGYVLSVENLKAQTRMMVLHSRLGAGQRPGSKDSSQGRMTLLYTGFLDPEVFTKDRKVTVAGRILAPAQGDPPPFAHLRLAVRDIHLWPIETETYDSYGYDGWPHYPWGWPHPWHHRRWHHRHWHHW